MDVQTFYEQYQKAPLMWDSIFSYLASIDPLQMEPSKNAMQWDASGCERYLMTRTPERLTPRNEYSEKKDVQNFQWDRAVKPSVDDCLVIDSDPKHFCLFFPTDIHQACGIGHQPEMPRKVVVKIDFIDN